MSNSNLVVKMMSGENLADDNTSKGFTIVEAYGEVFCSRDAEGKPVVSIPLETGQHALYHPEGNVYVIKNNKTVATFAYTEYKDTKDTKVTRVKGTVQTRFNIPLIVHETPRTICYKVSSLLEPMIVPQVKLEGLESVFYVAIKTKDAGFVIYPGTEILIQDPITQGARIFSYDELMKRLKDRVPFSLQGELNPLTSESFTEYDLIFIVAK